MWDTASLLDCKSGFLTRCAPFRYVSLRTDGCQNLQCIEKNNLKKKFLKESYTYVFRILELYIEKGITVQLFYTTLPLSCLLVTPIQPYNMLE